MGRDVRNVFVMFAYCPHFRTVRRFSLSESSINGLCKIAGCVGHAPVHDCDSDPRAWGSGDHARCVEQQHQSSARCVEQQQQSSDTVAGCVGHASVHTR